MPHLLVRVTRALMLVILMYTSIKVKQVRYMIHHGPIGVQTNSYIMFVSCLSIYIVPTRCVDYTHSRTQSTHRCGIWIITFMCTEALTKNDAHQVQQGLLRYPTKDQMSRTRAAKTALRPIPSQMGFFFCSENNYS